MMNKALIVLGLLLTGIAGYGLAKSGDDTTTSAYAFEQPGGRGYGAGYSRMIAEKATLLNMSEDELSEALKSKTFYEIAQEKGLSLEQMHERMSQRAQERWQEIGLSEEEQQERLREMEERHEGIQNGDIDHTPQMRRGGWNR